MFGLVLGTMGPSSVILRKNDHQDLFVAGAFPQAFVMTGVVQAQRSISRRIQEYATLSLPLGHRPPTDEELQRLGPQNKRLSGALLREALVNLGLAPHGARECRSVVLGLSWGSPPRPPSNIHQETLGSLCITDAASLGALRWALWGAVPTHQRALPDVSY